MSRPIYAGDQGDHGGTLLVTGEVAAGELPPIPRCSAMRLCFPFTYMRARLTDGPRFSVTLIQKASSNLQIVMLSCEFCNSKYVDLNGVIQILLDSQRSLVFKKNMI